MAIVNQGGVIAGVYVYKVSFIWFYNRCIKNVILTKFEKKVIFNTMKDYFE